MSIFDRSSRTVPSVSTSDCFTMGTTGRTCTHASFFLCVHVLNLLDSSNEVLVFETAAAGTSFAANSKARAAIETLVDGNRWMINVNVETQVRA
jgi:hypothetical protein